MAKPNSKLTVVRWWLSGKLTPLPDKGEGWCVKCSLAKGRTVIIPSQSIERHVNVHAESEPESHVKIVGQWM